VTVGAGCGGAGTTRVSSHTVLPWWQTAPRVEFGRLTSFAPLGRGYRLRLDLHVLFGVDKTGLAACIDNHECKPGTKSFLDDSYDHDFKYVLTYYVPATAPVQLVNLSAQIAGTVTARYLYGLSRGRNPRHLKQVTVGPEVLHEFGYYVQVAPRTGSSRKYETVTRLSQVFHP
jgi:hypothetical protein